MEDTEISVADIMTKKVVSVNPDTSLIEAAQIITEHNFDGLPVIDEEDRLLGIITEYDLISKKSIIYLPTLQIIIKNMPVIEKDKSQFRKDIELISSLTVKDVMNKNPITLSDKTNLKETVATFCKHHRINPIPVIDENNKVVGVISRFDILKPLKNIISF